MTLPRDEIARVSLTATTLPPDNTRWVEMEIDVVWGENFAVLEDTEGFTHVVRELCQFVRAVGARVRVFAGHSGNDLAGRLAWTAGPSPEHRAWEAMITRLAADSNSVPGRDMPGRA